MHRRARGKADQPVCLRRRAKTLTVWKLNEVTPTLDYKSEYGKPFRRLKGHSHFVEDVAISSDGMFALSGSWDNTMRLWNLDSGETRNQLWATKTTSSRSHSRQEQHIIPGSREKTINLWNTIVKLKHETTTATPAGSLGALLPRRAQADLCLGWLG